ncbi:MAG: AI-2E family transporter, partial [Methylobacterium sp.]
DQRLPAQIDRAIIGFVRGQTLVCLILGTFYALGLWLVGESVGLHPVWLMFALLAFGSLFGFLGLLLAVPVAASIGVLVRFALSRYLQSRLYHAEQPVLIEVPRA